ncbi:uncharacterized protein [Equus caballus]|uniref:uncharacterized protein isoform X1 n=1 Tax=Equus caballus TaxID=9796 RepID=UPI0038B3A05F
MSRVKGRWCWGEVGGGEHGLTDLSSILAGGALHVCHPAVHPQRVQSIRCHRALSPSWPFLGDLVMLHLVMGDYQEAGEAAKPPEGGHSCERFMSWTQPLPPAGPTVGQRSWAPPVRQQGKEINLEKRTELYIGFHLCDLGRGCSNLAVQHNSS